MLILFILIRSLHRRPKRFQHSQVQTDPIPAMKAFLAGLAT
jgi:hypothetical protein